MQRIARPRRNGAGRHNKKGDTNNPNGFNDDSDGTNDYTDYYNYDDDGNMVKDENKNITAIAYNHLGLPLLIEFGTAETDKIEYLYDATGRKLGKKVSWLPDMAFTPEVKQTDYLDGFQYDNEVLQFFPTAEGYVKNTPDGGENHYNYVYNYKDHLGNVRLSYGWDTKDEELKILEENNYYPFGLKHQNYNMSRGDYDKLPGGVAIVPVDKTVYDYKYNGKEWQDELGLNFYDYGARNYDPAIGRWMNIDPLAEKSRRTSSYTYALNNPVYFIDPDGMMAMEPTVGPLGNDVYATGTDGTVSDAGDGDVAGDNDDLILKGKGVVKTIETINSGLGGDYASVDNNGKLSLNVTEEQIANMTSEQKGLYNVINQTMNPSETTKITMLVGDHGVVVGDYKRGLVDIEDVNAYGTSVVQETKYSALGHEFNEQYEYQQGNKKGYLEPGSSHMNSSAKESTMNGGWERGKSNNHYNEPSFTKNVIRGAPGEGTRIVHGQNATYNISFSKNGQTVISTTEVVNGNVVPRN